MKKALFALIFVSISCTAAAAIDGIYSCSVTAQGSRDSLYVTVNSKDSQAVYTVAAISSYTPFYGYGIGTYGGGSYSGRTMFGRPFSFIYGDSNLSGSVDVLINGGYVTANANCTKIW